MLPGAAAKGAAESVTVVLQANTVFGPIISLPAGTSLLTGWLVENRLPVNLVQPTKWVS